MSYDAQESSVEGGAPVEFYKLESTTELFTYTSGPEDIQHLALTYVPKAISRTEPKIDSGEQGQDSSLTITLPVDDPFVQRYVISVPSSNDNVTIFRQHTTDTPTPETVVFFEGRVSGVVFKGKVAEITVEPTKGVLNRQVPKQTYRGLCNHVHYDAGCAVSDTDPAFRFIVTVDAISADGVTITVSASGLSAQLTSDPAFFDAGFLRQNNIDHRMATSVVDLTGDQADVSIILPFQVITVGETLDLLAGCDHAITTCNVKFNNEQRYGGFPWVPTRNPFATGVII